MYQEYWGLSEAPFDNVPDPGIYFRMHASVENAIAELLFAIEEGNECLALLIGGVGLGKTMALRVVLDKLEHFNRFLLEAAEAGQPALQRVGVCPILEPLGSEDLVGDSIGHRMEKAGSTRNVFTNSGIASVYEFSEGVPGLLIGSANSVSKQARQIG